MTGCSGMMDPAYFVGKNELLAWLNELLKLNYSKVEQCNTGAAYCQIIDAVYPVIEESISIVNFHNIPFLIQSCFVGRGTTQEGEFQCKK
jgi:hypothetical protein